MITITLEEVVRREIETIRRRATITFGVRIGPKPSPNSPPKLLAEHARRVTGPRSLALVKKVAA